MVAENEGGEGERSALQMPSADPFNATLSQAGGKERGRPLSLGGGVPCRLLYCSCPPLSFPCLGLSPTPPHPILLLSRPHPLLSWRGEQRQMSHESVGGATEAARRAEGKKEEGAERAWVGDAGRLRGAAMRD